MVFSPQAIYTDRVTVFWYNKRNYILTIIHSLQKWDGITLGRNGLFTPGDLLSLNKQEQ
jgi:hypothetical protein